VGFLMRCEARIPCSQRPHAHGFVGAWCENVFLQRLLSTRGMRDAACFIMLHMR
jgi:hypothetical protein